MRYRQSRILLSAATSTPRPHGALPNWWRAWIGRRREPPGHRHQARPRHVAAQEERKGACQGALVGNRMSEVQAYCNVGSGRHRQLSRVSGTDSECVCKSLLKLACCARSISGIGIPRDDRWLMHLDMEPCVELSRQRLGCYTAEQNVGEYITLN